MSAHISGQLTGRLSYQLSMNMVSHLLRSLVAQKHTHLQIEDIDFAIEHVDIEILNTRKDDPKFEARWTPLSTWCCWRGGLPSHPNVPIIVIVGRPNVGLPSRISALYSQDGQRRYNRLKALPYWIYTDLLFEFTKWDDVWSATRAHMNILRDEVYGEKAALPILEQTRALHRYMETIINQRECLRTHVTSVKAYTLSLSHLKCIDGDYGPFSAAEITNLEQRLDDIQLYLEHHQLTSETTVKSMENLLGLVSPCSPPLIDRVINLCFQHNLKMVRLIPFL